MNEIRLRITILSDNNVSYYYFKINQIIAKINQLMHTEQNLIVLLSNHASMFCFCFNMINIKYALHIL